MLNTFKQRLLIGASAVSIAAFALTPMTYAHEAQPNDDRGGHHEIQAGDDRGVDGIRHGDHDEPGDDNGVDQAPDF